MAGVTASCRECGFPIFDEQTRTMLCDECQKLPVIDRIVSGRALREQRDREVAEEQQRRQRSAQSARNRDIATRILRPSYSDERIEITQSQPRLNVNQILLAELMQEVKELRNRIEKYEITEENVSEVKSFLRKFDNLDVEGE
jgi:uncharacterized Zn finger protein (UPF0148 family)